MALITQNQYTTKRKDGTLKLSVKKWNNSFNKPELGSGSQEQLVLKYIEEAKLLQKLLDGTVVDHIQSNVKMQSNPLRKNKVEVDSIYGTVDADTPTLILVEAKDKQSISNTQLYAQYETFKLRLPSAWKLLLVAALMSEKTTENGKCLVIDLVQINFPDEHIGDITRSILNMEISRHYQWLIQRTPNGLSPF